MAKQADRRSEQDHAPRGVRWDAPLWGRVRNGGQTGQVCGLRAEVVVIGAGYAGLAAALALAKAGRDVLVIEAADFAAAGAASRNSGAISGGFGLSKGLLGYQPAGKPAVSQAELVAEASRSVETLRRVIANEAIACDLEWTGRLVAGVTADELDQLREQNEAWQTLGVEGVSFIDAAQMAAEMGTEVYGGGLRIVDAGRLDSVKLAQGLLDACLRHGVRYLYGTRVEEISQTSGSATCLWQGGEAVADRIILATNGMGAPLLPGWERRLRPIVTCTIATGEIEPELASRILPARRTASDILPAYSYFRMSADHRRMIFGGRMAWPTNTAADWPEQLAARMRSLFPQLREVAVEQAWNGIVVETSDLLPRSRVEGRVSCCMGCNGSGVAMMLHLGDRAAAAILGDDEEAGCRLLPIPAELAFPEGLEGAVRSSFAATGGRS
jgi:glycine/D-amino acid oxidase-like deaminating enzyme